MDVTLSRVSAPLRADPVPFATPVDEMERVSELSVVSTADRSRLAEPPEPAWKVNPPVLPAAKLTGLPAGPLKPLRAASATVADPPPTVTLIPVAVLTRPLTARLSEVGTASVTAVTSEKLTEPTDPLTPPPKVPDVTEM